MIAGFIHPDEGDIRLRGRSLVNMPPHKRETGVVFQHYALFPHMTVARNIAYGLEARSQPASLIGERVSAMMSLLKLDGFANRYPGELRRPAPARRHGPRPGGPAPGPAVQVGTPQDVYRRPGSSFVVEFLGSANRLPAETVTRQDGELTATTASGIRVRVKDNGETGSAFNIYVRSEDVQLSPQPTANHTGRPRRVTLVTFLGAVSRYVVDLDGVQVVADCPPGGPPYGMAPGVGATALSHCILGIPYVAYMVLATLANYDLTLEQASANLGASRIMTFRRVTFPLIQPGITAGGILVFLMSLDNVSLSLFTSGGDTLPLRLMQHIQHNADSAVAAVSTFLTIAAFVIMLLFGRAIRQRQLASLKER